MKKTILTGYVLSWLLLLPCMTFASASLNQQDIVTDTDTADTSGNHSLFAGTGIGSNMTYLGSTISGENPYGYASLTYGFKNELYLSLSGVHLTEFNPFVAFYTTSLSYTHVFNSWFDISAGIYRYNVASALADTLFGNFTYADLTLGFDWKILYTKISGGGLISDQTSAYFQIRNSRYFETPRFSRDRFSFSFDPYANVLFGTLTTMETTPGTGSPVTRPFRRWNTDGQSGGTTTYSQKLGIMELDLGLPVAFNTDRMTIEAEAGYIIPFNYEPGYQIPKGFVFLFSAFFRIF